MPPTDLLQKNPPLYNACPLMRPLKTITPVLLLVAVSSLFALADNKPKLTLDEFFNAVSFSDIELSPDGNSVVIATDRADWDKQIFRHDLWLYRSDTKTLIPLTQSGHDTDPQWSPDGRWIAFLSDRKTSSQKHTDSDSDSASKDDEPSQLYLISPTGGEAFAVTQGEEEVHAFSWSADSRTLYFAIRNPWSKAQKDDYRKEWKDVLQYRTAERGDTLFALDLDAAIANRSPQRTPERNGKDTNEDKDADNDDATPGARIIAALPLRIKELVTSPDGAKLAFATDAINQRQEKYEDAEIYEVHVARAPSPANADSETKPRQLTHNQAVEQKLHWSPDSRHIFFTVEVGDVSGPYRDLQPHLYWIDSESVDSDSSNNKVPEQWSKDFIGSIDHFAVTPDGVLTSARQGTEVQINSAGKPQDTLHKLSTWPGSYATIATAPHSPRIAFTYSALGKPEEVYLADSTTNLDQARPITSFNKLLTERALPQGKPYRWKADDGTAVEGMLIYPPGIDPASPAAKHLPMFTFIHGGPADADGNHFEADWYEWSALAATNGWLVFEPNYRGSTGYGDKFLQQIVPVIVSRPGKDILEGVDALVKEGIADPGRLTVGGYSYGGYMTNWLITQTTRFKAAVTGAGAVEHVGNWGNDDTTYDDAYFLGGRPWEAAQRYHDEAAIFQVDKVKTPTHMVAGADDIRVAVLEDYLLEHALYSLGIPNALLIFPGEGHSLSRNPWHGKIKVREELKWLQKYGGVPATGN
ncbi:MAG TPA: prolyl oligopeptidase family serine peptidase [Candidatus Sulfotelmatobacter sp.]